MTRSEEPSPSSATQGTEKSPANAPRARSNPLSRRYAKLRPYRTGSGVPWKSRTPEFTNPAGCRKFDSPASQAIRAGRSGLAHLSRQSVAEAGTDLLFARASTLKGDDRRNGTTAPNPWGMHLFRSPYKSTRSCTRLSMCTPRPHYLESRMRWTRPEWRRRCSARPNAIATALRSPTRTQRRSARVTAV